MYFQKFEDLWNYSEKISSNDLVSEDDAALNILNSLKEENYGEVLYNLSIITRLKNINIFVELQDAVRQHFSAQQEDS